MSYTPTTWQTGDTITAALLNKMEQGIAASGALVVDIEYDGNLNNNVMRTTNIEIMNAVQAGRIVVFAYREATTQVKFWPLIKCLKSGNTYTWWMVSFYENDTGAYVSEYQASGDNNYAQDITP